MIRYKLFLLAVFACVLAACSGEAVKRTAYETLQNLREQECSQQPSVECEKRDSLEVYEDRRKEVR